MSNNALAIIPARGGSKRLPGKNTRLLAGKPLIEYTIEAAIDSNCFSKIIVSSESNNILDVANKYKQVVLDKRAECLAGDEIKVIDVVTNICSRKEIRNEFNIVALLLPTCPFRNSLHIQEGIVKLTESIDTVISVTKFEYNPVFGLKFDTDTGHIKPSIKQSPLLSGDTRSQDHDDIYRPNGGFYIIWINRLLDIGNFFKGNVVGYEMNKNYSVDIDDINDFLYAECLIEKKIIEL